jgi:hypothetical protein
MELKELLGEELYENVAEKLGDKYRLIANDGSYIPKAKFDEVNTMKNEYKSQVDGYAKQLDELQKKAAGNDELLKQIDALKQQNEKVTADFESKLMKANLDHAIERAIVDAKGKNPRAILALLDTEKVKIENDKLVGIDEQLKAIRTSDAYLFDIAPPSSGANPNAGAALTIEQQYEDLRKKAFANPHDSTLKQQLFRMKEQIIRKQTGG